MYKESTMRSIAIGLILVLVVFGGAEAAKKSQRPKSKEEVVLAKVNDTTITMADFEEAISALPPQQQFLALTNSEEFLDSLVKRELVFQEAERQKLDNDPLVKQIMAKLRKEVLIQALLRRVMEKVNDVTDTEAKGYYQKNKEKFKTPEKITASHIVLKTEEEAQAVLAALKEGQDFADLARKHSIGPRAAQGGFLGSITRGEMPKEFDQVAFNLPVGKTSDIVKTPFGFHIIKVTERTAPRQLAYGEVAQQIQQRLRAERQQEAIREFLDGLLKKATVETYPDRLAVIRP
jgi:peptidyl-prolyl cis-trans isomerase C